MADREMIREALRLARLCQQAAGTWRISERRTALVVFRRRHEFHGKANTGLEALCDNMRAKLA